jgi:hypothetical protein
MSGQRTSQDDEIQRRMQIQEDHTRNQVDIQY